MKEIQLKTVCALTLCGISRYKEAPKGIVYGVGNSRNETIIRIESYLRLGNRRITFKGYYLEFCKELLELRTRNGKS